MKIAFVGKGGSGKTTISALYTKKMMSMNKSIMVYDADTNMHLKLLLGIEHPKKKILSLENNAEKIRHYLKGDNPKIKTHNHFVKTTPPGEGSNIIKLNQDNLLTGTLSTKIGEKQYFMEIGTYEKEGIGTSCYHTSLSILENILTHTIEDEDEWIIADMVAGTDAFSNTLHLVFDIIVFVLEPTPESMIVYNKYRELSNSAGMQDKIILVVNKYEDMDKEYLEKNNILPDIIIKYSPDIRRYSQDISFGLPEDAMSQMSKIYDRAKGRMQDRNMMLKKLHELHKKYSNQDYIIKTIGDITGQID
ncbi:MAG: hypothetical protein ACMXYL_05420 [Candidatus Woesearchaeota archaeon]